MAFPELPAWVPDDWGFRLLLAFSPILLGALLKLAFERKKPKISINSKINTVSIITDLSGDRNLSVSYMGQSIPSLRTTTALIWNSGSESIKGENLDTAEPVRLAFPKGTRILASSITEYTKEANGAFLDPKEEEIVLHFHFLNPEDAFIVHCLHTGPVDEVQLKGEMIGPAPKVNFEWTSQFGVHGSQFQSHVMVLDPKLFTKIGMMTHFVLVTILMAAFVFRSWIVVLIVSSLHFMLGIYALWRPNVVPRAVRRGLKKAPPGYM